ncbi:hypothetical protein MPSEU_000050100 [Mayamaea pseudoterrestris]|nr:hypothetical protein MPSEU_000050100 [Mayamaea pseudoterrestris]
MPRISIKSALKIPSAVVFLLTTISFNMSDGLSTDPSISALADRCLLQWETNKDKLPNNQLFVGVAGGPGSGKTTICENVVREIHQKRSEISTIVVPMDGFHYHTDELKEIAKKTDTTFDKLMLQRGSSSTYNAQACVNAYQKVRRDGHASLPIYDRSISNPVPNGVKIETSTSIIFFEGNYLLAFDEAEWAPLKRVFDDTWFIECANQDEQKSRLIGRHLRNWTQQKIDLWGAGEEGAKHKVEALDWRNVVWITERSRHQANPSQNPIHRMDLQCKDPTSNIMMQNLSLYAIAALALSTANGFTPSAERKSYDGLTKSKVSHVRVKLQIDEAKIDATRLSAPSAEIKSNLQDLTSAKDSTHPVSIFLPALIAAVPILTTAMPADAATGGGAVPSALFAYGHYFGLLAAMGLLVYERVTIQPGMTREQERNAAIADALYLISFFAIVATGASRTIDYGKGFDFYSHEPFFWIKMATVGVQGGIGAFPALTHLRRAKGIWGNEMVEPMSTKLSTRMHKVLNAEITGLLSIPFFATFMARGVWYSQEFPWQAGAAFTGLALLGSSALYAKQAFSWVEDDVAQITSPVDKL